MKTLIPMTGRAALHSTALTTGLLWTTTVMAHPGHEGHEDGGDFVWTLDHMGRNTGATLLCLALSAGTAWGLRRAFNASARLKVDVIRNQVAEKNS